LIREDVQKVEDKIPLIGDIPIIGRLFRSSIDQHIKRNLVILSPPISSMPPAKRCAPRREGGGHRDDRPAGNRPDRAAAHVEVSGQCRRLALPAVWPRESPSFPRSCAGAFRRHFLMPTACAHDLLAHDAAIQKEIAAAFGPEAFANDGTPDRARCAIWSLPTPRSGASSSKSCIPAILARWVRDAAQAARDGAWFCAEIPLLTKPSRKPFCRRNRRGLRAGNPARPAAGTAPTGRRHR